MPFESKQQFFEAVVKEESYHEALPNPPSRFECNTLHTMNQMCDAKPDENGFVMDYDQTLKLIGETYPGSMQVTEGLRLSDWQIAKKAYHANSFGIDIEKYQGISKKYVADMRQIKSGFIPYVRKGNKLAPQEFINDFQKEIYDLCQQEKIEVNVHAKHDSNFAVTLLTPHEKSMQFSNFILEIMKFCYSHCEIFEPDIPIEMIESYEVEFQNSIEKIHFKIQRFLNEKL